MPKPKKGESKKDYLNRCMGSNEMNSKFSDKSQRYAVCNSYWDNKDKKKNEQFVAESLEDVLKPKTEEEIVKQLTPLIDNFIDNISEEYFRSEFANDEELKSFKENGKRFYSTDTETLDGIILTLIHDTNTTPDGFKYRYEELVDLFSDTNIQDLMLPILRNKLAEKFNILY